MAGTGSAWPGSNPVLRTAKPQALVRCPNRTQAWPAWDTTHARHTHRAAGWAHWVAHRHPQKGFWRKSSMSVFMFREQEFSYSESKRMPGGAHGSASSPDLRPREFSEWWGEPGWYPRCLAPRCSRRIPGSQSRSLDPQAWEVPAAFLLPLRGCPTLHFRGATHRPTAKSSATSFAPAYCPRNHLPSLSLCCDLCCGSEFGKS